MEPFAEVGIVCLMVEARLPAIAIPLEAGAAYQRQAVPAGGSESAELLQPVRAQPRVVQRHRLPADLLQFPPHQHGGNGGLPHRRHALSEHFLRVALHLPFPEQVLQFLSALLVQAYGEPFPAQRDPVAGDKDEFPAVLFEHAGGAALPPAVKGMQPKEGHIVAGCQLLHQRLLFGCFHLVESWTG